MMVLLLCLASSTRASETPERRLRVLIIGNSYTRFNLLPHLIQSLAAAVPGGPHLLVDAEARSGFSLRMHWRAGQALARIRSGHYGFVVLQAHSLSAVDHPAELAQDTERFKQAVDATRGRTVLYETWARHPSAHLYRRHPALHSFAQMAERLDAEYAALTQQTGAQLAPVGSAFERAWGSAPGLVLWGPDGSHPTLAGSFLAACVLYGTITGEDPRLSGYAPKWMPKDRAEQIKLVAAQTLFAPHAAPAAVDDAATAAPEPRECGPTSD
jgi:hypothetical protein